MANDLALAGTGRSWRDRVVDALLGFDFFISYRSADARQYAEALQARLEAEGFRCFRDRREILPGSPLWSAISTALRRSTVVLVLVTPLAQEREHNPVLDELTYFRTQLDRDFIIPIVLQGALLADSNLSALFGGVLRVNEERGGSEEPSPAVVESIARSARFVRKRTLQLGAALLLATTFLLLAVVAVFQARRANAEKAVAQSQREIADQRLTEALAVAGEVEYAIDDKLRTVQGAATIRGELLSRVGDLLLKLGAEKDVDVTRKRRDGLLREGDVARENDNAKAAIALYSDALTATRVLLLAEVGSERERLVEGQLLLRLSASYDKAGASADRDAANATALGIFRALCGTDCPFEAARQLFDGARQAAEFLEAQGRLGEAGRLLAEAREATNVRQKLNPADATAWGDRADLERRQYLIAMKRGQSHEAGDFIAAAYADLSQLLAKGTPTADQLQTMAEVLEYQGAAAERRGEWEKVDAFFAAAREWSQRALATDATNLKRKLSLAGTVRRRGTKQAGAGRFDAAAEAYREGRQLLAGLEGEGAKRERMWLDIAEGELAFARADSAASVRLLTRAISVLQAPGPWMGTPWLLAELQQELGDAQLEAGRVAEAEKSHREALLALEKLALSAPENAEYKNDLAATHCGMGALMLRNKHLDEALQEYRAALSLLDQIRRADPEDLLAARAVASARSGLANVLLARNSIDEALAALAQAAPRDGTLTHASADPLTLLALAEVQALWASVEQTKPLPNDAAEHAKEASRLLAAALRERRGLSEGLFARRVRELLPRASGSKSPR